MMQKGSPPKGYLGRLPTSTSQPYAAENLRAYRAIGWLITSMSSAASPSALRSAS